MHWLSRLLSRGTKKQKDVPPAAPQASSLTPQAFPHGGLNFITLVKGKERYMFLFDDREENRVEVLRTAGRWAASAELSLTWYDAAVIGKRVRESRPIDCGE